MDTPRQERVYDPISAPRLHGLLNGSDPARASRTDGLTAALASYQGSAKYGGAIVGSSRLVLGGHVGPVLLNLGCGTAHEADMINVDAFLNCNPDAVWDLNEIPFPWADNSIDGINAKHVLEHLENWWGAFTECARILKPGGYLRIHVPDESSATALCYRDHLRVFNVSSFHGVKGRPSGTNAWAKTEEDSVPLALESYFQVPHKEYEWMARWCPRVLRFCANHLRNFIWEQQFVFRKIGG